MLFDEITLGGLSLKNRIVRSATFEKAAEHDGFVTDRIVQIYERLAEGGTGLLITGFVLVHPSGWAAPQMLCLLGTSHLDGMRRLTDAVHARGGVVAAQLVHGGRQCRPGLLGGQKMLAPSAIDEERTAEMTEAGIWEIIEAFADAAWRARAAGFDAVQLHAAHGYLISSFLSPYTNRRDDYWGGDEQRRSHFLEEVLKATRQAVGEDFTVLIKINADDLMAEGGLKPAESLGHVQRVLPLGLDAVELSGGMKDAPVKTIREGILRPELEAYFRDAGRLFKGSLQVPVILTGGMRTRAVIDEVLERGEADMVGMSRPLIREPDLPEKFLRQGKDAADCISCNKCTRYTRLPYVRCKQIREPGEEGATGPGLASRSRGSV